MRKFWLGCLTTLVEAFPLPKGLYLRLQDWLEDQWVKTLGWHCACGCPDGYVHHGLTVADVEDVDPVPMTCPHGDYPAFCVLCQYSGYFAQQAPDYHQFGLVGDFQAVEVEGPHTVSSLSRPGQVPEILKRIETGDLLADWLKNASEDPNA